MSGPHPASISAVASVGASPRCELFCAWPNVPSRRGRRSYASAAARPRAAQPLWERRPRRELFCAWPNVPSRRGRRSCASAAARPHRSTTPVGAPPPARAFLCLAERPFVARAPLLRKRSRQAASQHNPCRSAASGASFLCLAERPARGEGAAPTQAQPPGRTAAQPLWERRLRREHFCAWPNVPSRRGCRSYASAAARPRRSTTPVGAPPPARALPEHFAAPRGVGASTGRRQRSIYLRAKSIVAMPGAVFAPAAGRLT